MKFVYDMGDIIEATLQTEQGAVRQKAILVSYRDFRVHEFLLHVDPVARSRWALSEKCTGLAVVMNHDSWEAALAAGHERLTNEYKAFSEALKIHKLKHAA